MRSVSDIIKLDVGGVPMATSRATLLAEPNSTLAKMFALDSSLPPAALTEDGAYFLDADPAAFQVCLSWLRYSRLLLPVGLSLEAMAVLADFYRLGRLQEELARQTEEGGEAARVAVRSRLEVVDLYTALTRAVAQGAGDREHWAFLVARRDQAFPSVDTIEEHILEAQQCGASTIDFLVASDDNVSLSKYQVNITGSDLPRTLRVFRITVDASEHLCWSQCDKDSIPNSALTFSTQRDGPELHLGRALPPSPSCPLPLGLVSPGLGIRLRTEAMEKHGGHGEVAVLQQYNQFLVLCAIKKVVC